MPVVAGEEVFIAGLDDAVIEVERETCSQRWYMTASNDFIASPLVDDSMVYSASAGGNLYAVGSDPTPKTESPED